MAVHAYRNLCQFAAIVWIDDQNLVRRMQFTLNESVSGQNVASTVTVDFVKYGPQPKPTLPPADQVTDASSLASGAFGSGGAFCSSCWRSGPGIADSPKGSAGELGSAGERRFDPGKEQPGNDQPDPDHETEQAEHVNGREFAYALLP